MKTQTHTRGPWKIGPSGGTLTHHESCEPTPSIILPGSGAVVAQVGCGWADDQEIANARLIAAAPELLAALEDVVDRFNTETRAQARAAIAAAKGDA